MYDELVKRVRQVAEEVCDDYDVDPYNAEQRFFVIAEAADAIEELSKPRWIPVTERLPEDRHDVLAYTGVLFPYTTVGYFDGLWKFSYDDEEIAGGVDYWMPLPEPPEEE